MPRRLDHLVICVHDLAKAALDWQTLGFTLRPTGVHPFGTSMRLAILGNNYLELLTVADAAAVPPAAPGRFSFGAHNQDFLRTAEGMSMLALYSSDSHEGLWAIGVTMLAVFAVVLLVEVFCLLATGNAAEIDDLLGPADSERRRRKR